MQNVMPVDKVEYVVNSVVRHFVRRDAPAPEEDMRQEAWLIALDTLDRFERKKKVNKTGDLRGYLFMGVKRSLGDQVSRWLAVPSIKSNVRVAAQYEHRVPETEAPEGMDETTQPEAQLLDHERSVRRASWHTRFVNELERCLSRFEGRDAYIARRMYGLDSLAPASARHLATELDIPIRAVYCVAARLRRNLVRNERMQALRDELLDIE